MNKTKFSKPITFEGSIENRDGHEHIHAPFLCNHEIEVKDLRYKRIEWKISYRIIEEGNV